MPIKKVNKNISEIFIYLAILVVLLLTSFNINGFLKPKQNYVLGIETDNNDELFWQDLVRRNPDYIPGWIELGRKDKVTEIDPNYFVDY